MFSLQDPLQPRGPVSGMKEEPLGGAAGAQAPLGTVRNWMQAPSVVDQAAATAKSVFYRSILYSFPVL